MDISKYNFKPQEEELYSQIQNDIDYHVKRSKRLKNKANFFKISVMALGAIVTIVLGLQFSDHVKVEWDSCIQNIALILGAMITLLSGISNFWNAEKYWLNNIVTMMKLIDLRNDMKIEAMASSGIPSDVFNDLRGRFDEIQNEKIDYWESAYGA